MILNIVKNIKVIHPKNVLLVKIGSFYHAYGRDSYIISYLFGYKLIVVDGNTSSCGFPIHSLNKILARLEREKINYLNVDRRNNYETDAIMEFDNLNTYEENYKKAKIYINYKRRIDDINSFLVESVQDSDFKEILQEMENVIDERRKV